MTNSTSLRPLISIIIIIGCLWPALPLHAQDNYIIRHYTNENGLPANGVQGIELDKKNGFLWVGTQAGLVRFDGKHFMQLGPVKNTTIPSRISFIGKNREGTIFCEEENFSVYRIVQNRAEWAATDSFLIARFLYRGAGSNPAIPVGEMVEKLRHTPRSTYLPPWIVFHDEAGDSSSFSFINFDHAYHYSSAEDSLYDFPGFQNLFKIGSQVYFGRSNLDLWTYDKDQKKLVQVMVSGMPHWEEGATEKNRFIWTPGMVAPLLICQEDIWQLQGSGKALRAELLCRSCCPRKAYITSAQVWKEQGVIFLGSMVNGLYVARAPYVQAVRADTTADAKVEYAQAEIVPGIVNTSMGLAYSAQGQLLSGQTRIVYPNKNIYQDRQGDWWFNSGDTIIRFDPQQNRFSKLAVNDGSSKMVFAEAGNRLYVISDKSIAEITGRQYRSLYQLPFRPGSLRNTLFPTAALEWQPGILAMASEKLLLFNTEKGTAPDTIPVPGLTSAVRSLLKYGDYLFIGTYGQGFYIYKNGVVKKMPVDKNQYLAYVHCFVPDEKGYCWISTNHGLFKASLHALIAAYENNLDEIYYHYFGRDDGIVNTEFNGGCQPCALQLSSGLYSFPSMNGVAVFDPRQPHTPPPSGQLFIDEVLADSRSFQPGDSMLQALPYQTRNLRFRLAMPQFGNPENIYFSYKLETYNDQWETQDIIQNNTIQFGGLNAGSYTLYLRVRNGFEPGQFGTTVIRFRILKPWYQAWWFYTLCVLGFIAMTWGLVKWRTARIAQRKEELQKLVTLQTKDLEKQRLKLKSQLRQLQNLQVRLEEDNNIKARLIGIFSHDMISPLKFMGYMGKKLRDIFPESDSSYHTAGFIVNVAQELESLCVNILNWIKFHHQSVKMKPEKFNLHQLVTESVELPATLAKEKGLTFQMDVPEHTEIVQYRQAISVIVYNLSMNAMKYTAKGGIVVKGQIIREGLLLSVTDTGAGMSPELVKKLNSREIFVAGYSIGETSKYQFGYVIIKDLLRLADGSMHVESSLNRGTTISVQFRIPGSHIVPAS